MIYQHPLIPLLLSIILVVIIIKQCFVKHRFLKVKLLFSFMLTFGAAMDLVFAEQIKADEELTTIMNWVMLGFDAIVGVLLFACIDFSFNNEKLQKLLTQTINDSKFYVLLDKKDQIKEISNKFLANLGVEIEDVYGKNVFDVIELKYRIIGFNGQTAYKEDILKYYFKYNKKAVENANSTIELDLQESDAKESALYFHENTLFYSGKYKGRILMGDLKNEEELVGMEKQLVVEKNELTLIKNRFITILEKTSDGIYFNNLTEGSIWCNDVLVKKLSLNGNSISTNEFYKMIHPEDLAFYQEKLKNLGNSLNYKLSYRFNNGSRYIYVKEEGHKIICGKIIELCGIMTPEDNQSYAKTDTILDNILGEPEMMAKFQSLVNEDRVFLTVRFNVASIPEINEQFGRAIGNMIMSQYVQYFCSNYVNDNQIYRVSGLQFIAFVTDYRKMDMLKNSLLNNDKLLNIHADYINNQKINAEIYMGISYSNDTPNHKEALKNAKEALRFCSNPQFSSNYAYFRDIK